MKPYIRALAFVAAACCFVFLLAWFASGFAPVPEWPIEGRAFTAFAAMVASIFALAISTGITQ